MILLINQDRPADQKHTTFYFILGEQSSNLTVHDMRIALVNAGFENHRPQTTPAIHLSNFTSHPSSASMKSPMIWRLASFKKGIKYGVSAYSILRNECHIDKFQKDLFITAKSHDVSEILDSTFTPGPSQEEKELFEAKQTLMYQVFKETLLTDMGRYIVKMHLISTDA